MKRAAAELLRGVGCGETKFNLGTLAAHWRRRLSDAELGRLPPEWMALPAIDPG